MKKKFDFEKIDKWFDICNKAGEHFGHCVYKPSWGCWAWEYEDIEMSASCLREIVDFLEEQGEK